MNQEKGIESLEVYKLALDISDKAWDAFNSLNKNFQYHIGNQFLDAADSVGANIAEGYGRYHFKESVKFNLYARGSAFESRFWLNRLSKRNLIPSSISEEMDDLLDVFLKKVNAYNKYLRTQINK
ncbi:MAG: four helix bundle protein [Bacteroidales bacterium]|nr:four helix bundle protein [Bacteroidales bacterium]MCF8334370.1 four helix bundle protein [Bacteroidales bacterium]